MKIKPAQKIIDSEPMCIEDSVNAPWTDLELEDFHVKVFNDAYPVTAGHRLYVPVYNEVGVLRDAVIDAVTRGLKGIQDGEWDGFNVGINIGETAGQTCSWPHIHMIPRRQGDMENPQGGVRHVIPEKGNYLKW
jgi:diadenosine tetraphosphate (Ap4A) HIT family hydrolase